MIGKCVDVTVTHLHNHNEVRPVILTASEGNPAVINCEITFQSEPVGWFGPLLRLSIPENGEFLHIDRDLSDQELQGDHSKYSIASKYHTEFSIHPTNFSQALAVCGVRYHQTNHMGEINSTYVYCFESSFAVIIHSSHSQTSNNNCNNNTEVLATSIVTVIFGLLTASLFVIVGLLFLKLRQVTASSEVNPLLYVKKDGIDHTDLDEKKDTLERDAANISNGSSSQQAEVDHKLPDTISSRENAMHVPY